MTNCVLDVLDRHGDSACIGPFLQLWTSHIRMGQDDELGLKRLAGLKMNSKDFESSPTLAEWTVMDLNDSKGERAVSRLPYDDGSLDVVMIQLSVDYHIYPLEVMGEASRVLTGRAVGSQLYSRIGYF
jgi:hypothetical protein